MFLLYLGHSSQIRIGFLATLFPDEWRIIFTVFLATFIAPETVEFFLCRVDCIPFFLGNRVSRWLMLPGQTHPFNRRRIRLGIKNVRDSAGKAMTRLSKELGDPTPKPENATQTLFFSPNKWSESDLGWQKVAELEAGEYQVTADGIFVKQFDTTTMSFGPEGGSVLNLNYDRNLLPVPQDHFCGLVGRIGPHGRPFYIGPKETVVIKKGSALYLSINAPQRFNADSQYSASTFIKNTGGFEIEIRPI
jgi:hypothetical protein